ncbi:MAG TPA: acyl-ACP desaturase [Egibacteraceae bacterium]|nr:acyl-ACP desaturase [Egibacteraceae bacterium]
MTHRYTDQALLIELEPTAAELLNRHEKVAKEWHPHEYVPWSVGRDYPAFFDGGDDWTPDQPRLTGVAQTAFQLNLLTEDNLPSYHREIHQMFGAGDGAWINWANRWTAEEDRHGTVLRDYLMVTRNIDPYELERLRMKTLEAGYDRDDKDPLRGMAYVAFQELATRISHRNTGMYSQDPVADRIMRRISADENLHMIFYRDMLSAALELDPSSMVEAVTTEVMDFAMPGAVIEGFRRKAVEIANAGIYDLRIHHDEIVWPLLRHWGIFELEGLDEAAEKSRQQLAHHMEGLDKSATRFEEKRAARRERDKAAVS